MASKDEIKAGYDQMWSVGKIDLANRIIDFDPLPDAIHVSMLMQAWLFSQIL